jgi:anti-sigma regulatory factor (Ser/Thr protein kinase)
MRTAREKSNKIREFLLNNIQDHPRDITSFAAEKFGLTRNAILWHLNKLIARELISAHGSTKDRYYELIPLSSETFSTKISDDLEEDQLWLHIIRPNLKNLPENVLHICEYGLSEMINNAIEHSEGNTLTIKIDQYAPQVTFSVIDDGIGIFRKIQRDFELNDPRHAILELAKGKLTTDPKNHSGEGIFFTSRMFNRFIIISKGLYFSHHELDEDWLLEHDIDIHGTSVQMCIRTNSDRKINEVFDEYASDHQDFGFTRTHVPLSLATYGDENLISRSQARRLLSRFRDFSEVFLDFDGVKTIGQAFADEIFRVFARNNPDIDIHAISTNKQIAKMISRAESKLRSS